MKNTEQNTTGLREALFEELDNLRGGKTTPQKASAMARIASTIVAATKLDLDYQRFVSSTAGAGKGIQSPSVPSMRLGKA